MRQQIIISGIGGQGVLFLTRILGSAGLQAGSDVLTSETHGMAMRGGTVVSHVKIGPFRSPLIRSGKADVGLFLSADNLSHHGHFLGERGKAVINTEEEGAYSGIDATGLAKDTGSILVTNLVLLGYAVQRGILFCGADVVESVIEEVSNPRHRELNLAGFQRGLNHKGGIS